ncbi:uncharacterized protein LOC124306968 isoform X3 [Neodiprion virginianus]|uniref:Uncharacterized protein LOC124293074 isoform X4 n=2 Tax=Neodiprion TaxID=270857 RepID=A0ABM3GD62_NEOLC|nr:uncharacterized protein LOC124174365 isoform X3 [Neodiprion fabricii]XP_046415604.1 uncharacterized protein LOC124177208 isoform X3 [Neodiprion fabricii]XP_046418208.1 uncharacterized protein LOC124178693 isoform X3 [Neodiprion fabricii]XP_046419959.1 uncharacterized protein LOC124179400 isoform X3 [Neodiprion fabricii]XP_046588240.1 uncharacterized protein LOC124293074 isoform X4 [Neodiprion lecontei]XP_046598195.1 uncharacterized protein LOC124294829 isoform X4 [Neodiprion lecontei]XP_04
MEESASKAEKESMAKTIAGNVKEQKFWVVIRKELGVDPPLYLKHLLTCLGFDSAAALKNLSSEAFLEMEKFAQTDMLGLLGEDGYTKSDFFGIYSNTPEQFRILRGHRFCLFEIQKYIIEKGLNHFATAEQDINEKLTNIKAKKETKETLKAVSGKKSDPQSRKSQDLLSEEDQLYMLIKNWFSKQPDGEETFKDYLESPKNRYIEVSVKEDVDEEITYSGKISCCLCKTKITAHKAEYGKSVPRKTRWVCQNFMKHVKEKHLTLNPVENSKENLFPRKHNNSNKIDTKSGQAEKNTANVLKNVVANTTAFTSSCKKVQPEVQPLITDVFDKGTNDNDNWNTNASLSDSIANKNQKLGQNLPRIIEDVKLVTPVEIRRDIIKIEKSRGKRHITREIESDDETEAKPTKRSKNRIESDEELEVSARDKPNDESDVRSQAVIVESTNDELQGEFNLGIM